jgi:hypothetical protein
MADEAGTPGPAPEDDPRKPREFFVLTFQCCVQSSNRARAWGPAEPPGVAAGARGARGLRSCARQTFPDASSLRGVAPQHASTYARSSG